MKINNKIKEIEEEINNIEMTFKTVGRLGNYQERMTTQVFIDIRNQFDKLLKQFQKEIKAIQGELGEIHSKRAINEMFKKRFGDEE